MNSEQQYYENPDLWTSDRYGASDRERIATLAEKLPPDVTSLLDVGCGNGLFLKHLSSLKKRRFERLCGAAFCGAAFLTRPSILQRTVRNVVAAIIRRRAPE